MGSCAKCNGSFGSPPIACPVGTKDARGDYTFCRGNVQYVDDSTGQLEKTLAAYWEEIKALQEQIPVLQQQDNLTGTWMGDMQKRLEDICVSQVKFATDLVEEIRKALSVEMDRKVTTVQVELQQQVNETHRHL